MSVGGRGIPRLQELSLLEVTALAVAERRKMTGRDLILAYNLGVEVETKVSEAMSPRHYQHGFHSTATCGTLASASAVSRLYGLELEPTLRALAIAASGRAVTFLTAVAANPLGGPAPLVAAIPVPAPGVCALRIEAGGRVDVTIANPAGHRVTIPAHDWALPKDGAGANATFEGKVVEGDTRKSTLEHIAGESQKPSEMPELRNEVVLALELNGARFSG